MNNAKLASRLTRVLRHAFGQPTLDYQARVMMRDIPGFGPAKLHRFGEHVCRLCAEHSSAPA